MSSYGDDDMDFGDDDDGDFLTGKLAALGIDEDLELSGGEEENEDPAPAATAATATEQAAASSSPPPPPSNPIRTGDNRGEETPPSPRNGGGVEGDAVGQRQRQQTSSAAATEAAPPSAEGAAGGGVEDGEILDMLEKPLQSSRYHSQQGSSRDRHGNSGGGGRKSGKRGKSRSKNGKQGKGNLTIKECATLVCEKLNEPKYYLMCQVVATIGYNKSKSLLDRVKKIQDDGGMATADGTRKRSSGGVFFTLLKEHMSPAKLKALYADEIRVKREKDRAKRAALKRRAEATEAGEDTMPPRNRPRPSGGGGGTTWRDMGRFVGPSDDGDAVKRARANQSAGDW